MPIMSADSNSTDLGAHQQFGQSLPAGQYVVVVANQDAREAVKFRIATTGGFTKEGTLSPKNSASEQVDGPTELKVDNLSEKASVLVRVSPLVK